MSEGDIRDWCSSYRHDMSKELSLIQHSGGRGRNISSMSKFESSLSYTTRPDMK